MTEDIWYRVLAKYLSEFWNKLLVCQEQNQIGLRPSFFLFNFLGQRGMASFEGSVSVWPLQPGYCITTNTVMYNDMPTFIFPHLPRTGRLVKRNGPEQEYEHLDIFGGWDLKLLLLFPHPVCRHVVWKL